MNKKIEAKVEELKYLMSDLPTMKEIVKTSDEVIRELQRYSDTARMFLLIK